MQRLLLVFVLVLGLNPAIAHAVYTEGIVHTREIQANGTLKIIVDFFGSDPGEEIATRSYTLVPGATAQETYQRIRQWVYGTINELNLSYLGGKVSALEPGKIIQPLAPVVPALTPKQVWQGKVNGYRAACTSGFVGSIVAACTALKADIEGTYAAGFLVE